MGVDATHPQFSEFAPIYTQLRHTYRGERIVKEQGTAYLPATQTMIDQGLGRPNTKGQAAYDAYRTRARFPGLVREAVESLLGVMHRKPATIELPPSMEYLRDSATSRNESLQTLLRRINEEQLAIGRCGLLTDVAGGGERADEPYIALYQGEHVRNWDEGRTDGIEVDNLNLVILDESESERTDEFEWEFVRKYRVLMLTETADAEGAAEAEDADDPPDGAVANLPQGEGVYMQGVFREEQAQFDPFAMFAPSVRGQTLDEIPFVFVNTKDVVAEPDEPPLLDLSDLSLTIYRGEADYRQGLFLQGQDTLVVISGDKRDSYEVGASASITLPIGGDAKFIGVSSEGLAEQRQALENDYARAGQKGGNLLDTIGSSQQSGEALRVRVAAKTATVTQVALTGAYALERILKIIAKWVGANPEQVVVLPNLDFADDQMSGRALGEIMAAKSMGAPLSMQSVHEIMQERGLTKLSLEDELALIAEELLDQGSSAEDGPEDDEIVDDESAEEDDDAEEEEVPEAEAEAEEDEDEDVATT